MEWIFDIFKENYDKIKNSSKEVEGRVPDFNKPAKHYNKIESGDTVYIRVVGPDFKPIENIEPLVYTVKYNKKYDSVADMVNSEGLNRVLPEVHSLEEAVALYHNLPGYAERIKQNGIYAIGLNKK